MADYPSALPNFGPDEVDGVDFNYAAHINKLRLEVAAIANELGVRGGLPTSIGIRLSAMLTQLTILTGRFDGGGKLPHTGVAGVTSGVFANPETTWDNLNAFEDASASWRVNAAGMCVWQGMVTIGFDSQMVILTGAPAPFDARTHSFKVRRGVIGGYNLANISSPFIAFADYVPQTGNMARPQYFVDEGGVCHVSGIVYANSLPTTGNTVLDYLPSPVDGENHVFRLPDIGNNTSSPTVTLDGLHLNLRVGTVVRGSGAESIGTYGGPGVPFIAGHAYMLDFEYQCNPGGISIDVLADGTGYYNGPNIAPLGSPPYGGSEYLSLDGISYYAGPGAL